MLNQLPNKKKKLPAPMPRKYFSINNLRYIWKNYPEHDSKASGIDKETPEKFKDNLDARLYQISHNLSLNKYDFKKLRVVSIPKGNGKNRIICIPTVSDRLVQRLILHHLTVSKDRLSVQNDINFGTLSGYGMHSAIEKALKLRNKYPWVLKTDISAFFDNIDRKYLIKLIKNKLKKSRLIPLLEKVVNCDVIENDNNKNLLEINGITIGKGLRQGMPLSPLLSNVFLSSFDNLAIKKSLKIIRYVDDIIVFSNSEAECKAHKTLIEKALNSINLTIPFLGALKSKTEIKSPDLAVIFLGVEIYKCKNGEFKTKIPQEAINEILIKFNQYSDYQFALEEKLNYATLIKKLKDMKSDYKSAYKGTTNLNTFLQQLNKKEEKIKNTLIQSILGKKVFNSLSEDKKKFLGLI